jgi:cytochrome P450
MHPEEQDKLHAEASKLGDSPAYEEFTSLVRCQAVFNETLRLFPPVPGIPKYAVEDTFVPYHTIDTGEKRQMLIPKDSRIMVDEISLASNPDLWESPNEFKPDRFIDTPTYKWNRAAFMPFSGGVRSCIGQRFAQVEGAIMLALISKHYKLELQESDTARYRAGSESFESMQDRVLASDTYSLFFGSTRFSR